MSNQFEKLQNRRDGAAMLIIFGLLLLIAGLIYIWFVPLWLSIPALLAGWFMFLGGTGLALSVSRMKERMEREEER